MAPLLDSIWYYLESLEICYIEQGFGHAIDNFICKFQDEFKLEFLVSMFDHLFDQRQSCIFDQKDSKSQICMKSIPFDQHINLKLNNSQRAIQLDNLIIKISPLINSLNNTTTISNCLKNQKSNEMKTDFDKKFKKVDKILNFYQHIYLMNMISSLPKVLSPEEQFLKILPKFLKVLDILEDEFKYVKVDFLVKFFEIYLAKVFVGEINENFSNRFNREHVTDMKDLIFNTFGYSRAKCSRVQKDCQKFTNNVKI